MTALRKNPDAPLSSPRSRWSAEQRLAAANRCRIISPWKKSTGPRTDAGKFMSSQNAFKHGGFSAESKSIRAWLCDASRRIKWIKAAYRHYEYMQKHAPTKISPNELSSNPITCHHKHSHTSPFMQLPPVRGIASAAKTSPQ